MAFEGMDVDTVTNLGTQLKSSIGPEIQNIVNSIDSIVNQLETAWKGADATEFQGWWTSQHKPALLSCMTAVEGLGQSALNNALAQTDASKA